MSVEVDRYGEWTVRGGEYAGSLREDGVYLLGSFMDWSGRMREEVGRAVGRGLAGDELRGSMLEVYGGCLVVIEDQILPVVNGSRYRLMHSFALDVSEDIRSFWYGTDEGLVPEVVVGAPRPDHRCVDPAVWRKWMVGCCDWLCERCQAHAVTSDVLAQDRGVAAYSVDQVMVNIYGAAIVVAGAAAGWATCGSGWLDAGDALSDSDGNGE